MSRSPADAVVEHLRSVLVYPDIAVSFRAATAKLRDHPTMALPGIERHQYLGLAPPVKTQELARLSDH
jgi:hypothetical protein